MQILFNGLINGLAIALLALAFQLVYLPTRIFFIGLAALYSATPFLALAISNHSGSWIAGVVGSLACVVCLALLFEFANHRPLTRSGASEAAHLVSSLGLYIVVAEMLALIWGNSPLRMDSEIEDVTALGMITVADPQAVTGIVAGSLLILFFLLLNGTTLGLRLRALADNSVQFVLFGFDSRRHTSLVFALAALFAGVASLLTSYDIGFGPHAGLPAVLIAVVAVMVGGRFSFAGAVLGGVLIGIVRAEVAWVYSALWQDATTFLVLAVFLLFRPQGLLGTRTRMEATT